MNHTKKITHSDLCDEYNMAFEPNAPWKCICSICKEEAK